MVTAKYLVQTEDNEVYKSNEITDNEKDASNDGYLTIIDLETMKLHISGNEWADIKEWDNSVFE